MGQGTTSGRGEASGIGGLAGWLWRRLRGQSRPEPRLTLLERITLAPRQSLALVEADGRKFLIATSAEGSPAFCALEQARGARQKSGVRTRVSW